VLVSFLEEGMSEEREDIIRKKKQKTERRNEETERGKRR
jgi:hypothetical protein